MRDETHHHNRLVATFVDNHLEFKLVKDDVWIHFYERLEYGRYKFDYWRVFDYRNYKNDCLNYPIIFLDDNDGIVQELFFLSDVPLAKKNQTIEGFSISYPSKEACNTILYYNGVKVFNDEANPSSAEQLFYKTVINHFALQKQVEFIQEESKSTCEYFLNDDVKHIKEYLDTLDLNEILSDLKVKVDEWHHVKLGDDDTYGIFRIVSVSNPIVKEDRYLNRIIKPGQETIYEVSGFSSWRELRYEASDFLEQHPLGEYSGELLEKEKQRILSSYSREDHLIHLLIKRFEDRDKYRSELPVWEKHLQEARNILINKFHYNELLRINDPNCKSGQYGFSNTHDMVKELSSINAYIKHFTIYNDC